MFKKDILSEIDLDFVDDLLHDSIVEPKDIKYDKYAKSLDLFFYRIMLGDESRIKKKRFLFIFTILEFPVVKSLFHLDNINFLDIYTAETDAKEFYLEGIIKKGNYFEMLFNPTLEIRFSFKDEIKGYLEDIKILSPSEAKNFRFWVLKCFNFPIWGR